MGLAVIPFLIQSYGLFIGFHLVQYIQSEDIGTNYHKYAAVLDTCRIALLGNSDKNATMNTMMDISGKI